MSEELKSCEEGADFCCVGVVKVRKAATMESVGYRAVCDECLERGELCRSEADAITAWNTRAGEKA